LILAGVTINLTLGEGGIIRQAGKTGKVQKYATYLEQMQLRNAESILNNEPRVSAIGEDIKNYIDMEDSDIAKFAIIDGELKYIGTDATELEYVGQVGITSDVDIEKAEVLVFVMDIVNNNKAKQGIQLADIAGSSTYWAIVSEIKKQDNEVTKRYGTGYYYLEKGTQVNGKDIENGYVIDYENKTVISCKESEQYTYVYLDINPESVNLKL